MQLFNLHSAMRAPFWKRSGNAGTPDAAGIDYARDNGHVLRWQNKAGTANVDGIRVDALNRLQALSTLSLCTIPPGAETSGSLVSNDLRWSVAAGTLVNVVVLSNVGTFTFSENHNLQAGTKIVVTGATVDTDLNATYSVLAASVDGDAKKLTVTTSAVTNGTYVDAALLVTAWQNFRGAGSCAVKLLAANLSATGNFATLRIRARSDVATPTWNQNTMACDLSASANIADYGELLGLSSYAQDNGYNQARVDHWSSAVKACVLCTGTSAGSRYALQVTDYSTTKAATAHYLARFDKPAGAQAIDGVFKMGNCDQFTYLFNFEVAGGYLTDSDSNKDTDAGCLAVATPGGAKFIKLFT